MVSNVYFADEEYQFPLDAEFKKKAENELKETDKERIGSVRALREWAIQRQDWLKTPLDTEYLLRFLRVRKFSQLAARKTLENFWTSRTKYPEWFSNVDMCDPDIQEIIGTGYCLVCPGTDKDGCRLVFFERTEHLDVDWAIKKFGVNKIFKAMVGLSDWLLMDPNVQVNGIVAIEDMTAFSIKHSMELYTTDNTKKWLALWQDGYPMRTKAMHIYNEPPIFDPLMALIKQFMKPKMKKRIHMTGKNLTNLYKKVDMDMLPLDYLPDDYKGCKVGSAKDVIAYMQRETTRPEVRDEILALTSGKYRVDLAKKPKDDEPQASFRKLNVS